MSEIAEIEKMVNERRNRDIQLTMEEKELFYKINARTVKGNLDNISRTKSYASFYRRHNEIRWSFLASQVSRNAGWNMTDLEGEWFPKILSKKERKILFSTYERANWLIFSDAYPQLLVYEYSNQVGKPYFHMLKLFSVSRFIESEWEYYWRHREGNRLVTAQIINEQNIIQKPVIEHPFYRKRVFQRFFYNLQDLLHFSSAIFPTLEGRLYGFSVHQFTKLDARIELGKKLASLLFHNSYYDHFLGFSNKVEHTGSRFDYEQYVSERRFRNTPFLRTTYPIIRHTQDNRIDWYRGNRYEKWFDEVELDEQIELTNWYLRKQKQMQVGILIEEILRKNKG
ncbi:DUF2515 domain-containing protein [Fredinandcohnia sp. QZ13]|uniref:DUF2515 domain-containing protein n=1 Tax=Fredinandcohnia sp. QZ13 TaxID=3073144 RepID=UPI0028532860|nr:DUF2515 domain-containing protein [Fredinandcohnia sp. QZ13]MDR4888675.1 DUF2515 domain-containing protein [Fredinandcohnia sp. QZ13]